MGTKEQKTVWDNEVHHLNQEVGFVKSQRNLLMFSLKDMVRIAEQYADTLTDDQSKYLGVARQVINNIEGAIKYREPSQSNGIKEHSCQHTEGSQGSMATL